MGYFTKLQVLLKSNCYGSRRDDAMKIRAKVIVKGVVQGVSFRYFTFEKARINNVTGWVKNLANGDVQGCFEGEEKDVNALVDWCRTGPRLARVDEVIVETAEFADEFRDFRVR
jgi:acylphosphatase